MRTKRNENEKRIVKEENMLDWIGRTQKYKIYMDIERLKEAYRIVYF